MLMHMHISSTLCGYHVRSKGEAGVDLEKEKEETERPDAEQVLTGRWLSVRSILGEAAQKAERVA
jgi:hypothetical protein